jgi:hypothetical protein
MAPPIAQNIVALSARIFLCERLLRRKHALEFARIGYRKSSVVVCRNVHTIQSSVPGTEKQPKELMEFGEVEKIAWFRLQAWRM